MGRKRNTGKLYDITHIYRLVLDLFFRPGSEAQRMLCLITDYCLLAVLPQGLSLVGVGPLV